MSIKLQFDIDDQDMIEKVQHALTEKKASFWPRMGVFFLRPGVVTAFLVAVVGPLAVKCAADAIEHKKIQQAVVAKLLEQTSQADFSSNADMMKAAVLIGIINENKDIFGISTEHVLATLSDAAKNDLQRQLARLEAEKEQLQRQQVEVQEGLAHARRELQAAQDKHIDKETLQLRVRSLEEQTKTAERERKVVQEVIEQKSKLLKQEELDSKNIVSIYKGDPTQQTAAALSQSGGDPGGLVEEIKSENEVAEGIALLNPAIDDIRRKNATKQVRNQLANAIFRFDRALKYDPNNLKARIERARALRWRSQAVTHPQHGAQYLRDAIGDLNRVIAAEGADPQAASNPWYGRAYYNKACYYAKYPQLAEDEERRVKWVQDNLRAAIQRNPKYGEHCRTDNDFDAFRRGHRGQFSQVCP